MVKNNKVKRYMTSAIIIWILIIAASAFRNISEARITQEQTYLEMGQSIFDLLVTTRAWNAQLGGVYVFISDEIQPNQYLDDPLRDIITTDGLELTKINPAYMTRLIAEFADERDNVKIHITSLKPIRPDNRPSDWEAIALDAFETGDQEQYSGYYDDGSSLVFRYMAPLITEQSCLQCHAKQGYQVGDIRGGISVEFPVEFNTNWTLILSHIFIALGGSGLILIFGTKLNNVMRILDDQSKLDGLTQIHNYRYFQEFYDREFLFSRRHHIPLSFAICDINNFKFYNDSYGHLAGDDCLKRVAQTLKSVLKRPGDLVARYGGDEFVFVLPNTKAAGALDIADLLRSEVEALQIPHKESEASDYVTISIGVTTSLCFDITRDELFEIADQALYQAKENSDKFVIFLEPQLNQSDDQQ